MADPAPQPAAASVAIESLPAGDQVLQLDPRLIEPNPKQPRSVFNEEALQELAESIRRDGVQEPVIVRKAGDVYQLVSGERRVRASIMADLEHIPAIARDVPDADMLKFGLIENIQREDLNAIELAVGYKALMEECSWTQEELASQVGKNRVTVTNTLRLLNLPPDVQAKLADGSITMGHARALLALPTPEAQRTACRKVIDQGLSVRQTEKLAAPPQPSAKKHVPKDANIQEIEDDLRRRLGTRVTLRTSPRNRGKIEIEYFNLDDFERILAILRTGPK
ncbi:MAG: ParB/RepB/Spo0J family partition protein [Candidatus Hydrogenedentes bacterium]|nr:ParB/RepB/Spo0J family partition protein [Candidatus Hydrogenedentota bacterium]